MPPGLRGAGPEDLEHGVDGLAADPGLDAEPSAGHQRAQHGRHVGAAHAERSAHEDRKRECRTCAPACALSSIGTSTIRLPSRMVPMACHQLMPPAMRPDASM